MDGQVSPLRGCVSCWCLQYSFLANQEKPLLSFIHPCCWDKGTWKEIKTKDSIHKHARVDAATWIPEPARGAPVPTSQLGFVKRKDIFCWAIVAFASRKWQSLPHNEALFCLVLSWLAFKQEPTKKALVHCVFSQCIKIAANSNIKTWKCTLKCRAAVT